MKGKEVNKTSIFCYITCTLICVFIIGGISFFGFIKYMTLDYVGVYECHECEESFVGWSNNCVYCGAEHNDKDLVHTKPYCSECGKSTTHFSQDFCSKCGGVLVNNDKVPIKSINNSVVKWCLKHL